MAQGTNGEHIQVKTQWLGPGEGYSKEIKIFNRIVGCNSIKGITFEADLGNAEIIINQLELSEAKVALTLGTKEQGITIADCDGYLRKTTHPSTEPSLHVAII